MVSPVPPSSSSSSSRATPVLARRSTARRPPDVAFELKEIVVPSLDVSLAAVAADEQREIGPLVFPHVGSRCFEIYPALTSRAIKPDDFPFDTARCR